MVFYEVAHGQTASRSVAAHEDHCTWAKARTITGAGVNTTPCAIDMEDAQRRVAMQLLTMISEDLGLYDD